MRKNKGFTLIELLAVIVILALLVLVAVPAITNIIQNSTKNSFKNEVNALVKNMQNAYANLMNEQVGDNNDLKDGKVHTIEITEKDSDGQDITVKYSYLCMTLQQLVENQYTQKNDPNAIKGYIQIFVPNSKSGQQKTVVNMSQGRFYYQGELNALQSITPSLEKVNTNELKDPLAEGNDSGAECPTEVNSIPITHTAAN